MSTPQEKFLEDVGDKLAIATWSFKDYSYSNYNSVAEYLHHLKQIKPDHRNDTELIQTWKPMKLFFDIDVKLKENESVPLDWKYDGIRQLTVDGIQVHSMLDIMKFRIQDVIKEIQV